LRRTLVRQQEIDKKQRCTRIDEEHEYNKDESFFKAYRHKASLTSASAVSL